MTHRLDNGTYGVVKPCWRIAGATALLEQRLAARRRIRLRFQKQLADCMAVAGIPLARTNRFCRACITVSPAA